MRRSVLTILLVSLGLLLAGCGAGGSSVAEGGIGGTGVSVGRVTQIGSVFVNGVHYNTDSARFVIEGEAVSQAAGQSAIAVGMVVSVKGTKDDATLTGTAEEVRYESLLKGTLDSVLSASSLLSMGQTVTLNADTVYENSIDGTALTSLPVGAVIEVSGFHGGADGILATRIEVEALAWTGEPLKVTGPVSNPTTSTLEIGGLTIDATGLSIPPAGSYVEVRGASPPVGGVFDADSISVIGNGDGTVADDGEEIELEGQITVSFDSVTQRFTLNSQVVEVLPGTTVIRNGTTADLLQGRLAEAEGVMAGTVLLAEEIELKASESSKEELGGSVSDITLGAGGAGSITLLGQTVLVNNSTILESDLSGESTFTLAELQTALLDGDDTNDYVEVKVYRDDNGDLVAIKIEREELPSPDPFHAELEGVSVLNGGVLTVVGVRVNYGSTGFTPTDGQRIEVTGTYDPVDDSLDAIIITPSS